MLLSLVLPAAADSGEARQYFRDWLTACRSDGYCSATTYVNPRANGTVADYILRIGRHATETYWEISLTTVATMADDHLDFTVAIDGGAPQVFTPPANVAAYGSVNDFYFIGAGAEKLLDRLVAGGKADFGFKDADGRGHAATFSLAGLGAALIAIDTQQHRIGSERVAEAAPVGLAPAGAAAAPLDSAGATDSEPASPLPLKEVPPALLAQINADSSCSARDITVDQLTAADLTDGYTLFIVPCMDGPTYKVQKAYLDYSDTFDVVAFPQYLPSAGWFASPYLFDASFDADARTISSTYKSGKLGDCGMAGTWAWAGTPFYTDKGFKLVEFRAKQVCDGVVGDFPVVYPASE